MVTRANGSFKSTATVTPRQNGKRFRRRKEAYKAVLNTHFVMPTTNPDGTPRGWSCSCGTRFGFSDSWVEHTATELAKLDLG